MLFCDDSIFVQYINKFQNSRRKKKSDIRVADPSLVNNNLNSFSIFSLNFIKAISLIYVYKE